MAKIVGIDEVGRGPLAGPVTICVVACDKGVYFQLKKSRNLPKRGFDSKKLTSEERKFFCFNLKNFAREQKISYAVVHISNTIIDERGLSFALKKAIEKGIKKLNLNTASEILLDGSLKAPAEFFNQRTIIKGDEKEKIISWASILAKVSRDNLMERAGKKFGYEFENHKGYATPKHRELILQNGLSPYHRKSFCRNLT